jgi:hypothetical protein
LLKFSPIFSHKLDLSKSSECLSIEQKFTKFKDSNVGTLFKWWVFQHRRGQTTTFVLFSPPAKKKKSHLKFLNLKSPSRPVLLLTSNQQIENLFNLQKIQCCFNTENFQIYFVAMF